MPPRLRQPRDDKLGTPASTLAHEKHFARQRSDSSQHEKKMPGRCESDHPFQVQLRHNPIPRAYRHQLRIDESGASLWQDLQIAPGHVRTQADSRGVQGTTGDVQVRV